MEGSTWHAMCHVLPMQIIGPAPNQIGGRQQAQLNGQVAKRLIVQVLFHITLAK
jgi:hypothetical protein